MTNLSSKKQYPIDQSPLFRLRSKRKLASLLHVSVSKLKHLSQASGGFYKTHYENSRLIVEPRRDLKILQKRLSALLLRINSPEYLHSPAKGRSPITNAKVHRGFNCLQKLDIAKHFPSITKQRVSEFFRRDMQCSSDVSAVLANLCTFDGYLPTGSPSSPALAYFALRRMWTQVEDLTIRYDCMFTLYADDVTISGNHIPKELIRKIEFIFKQYGLTSNKRKARCYKSHQARNVTGVVIIGEALEAPRKIHKKSHELRKRLRGQKDSGEEKSRLISSLQGVVAHIKQIEDANMACE